MLLALHEAGDAKRVSDLFLENSQRDTSASGAIDINQRDNSQVSEWSE
jgi:hypothetical protein